MYKGIEIRHFPVGEIGVFILSFGSAVEGDRGVSGHAQVRLVTSLPLQHVQPLVLYTVTYLCTFLLGLGVIMACNGLLDLFRAVTRVPFDGWVRYGGGPRPWATMSPPTHLRLGSLWAFGLGHWAWAPSSLQVDPTLFQSDCTALTYFTTVCNITLINNSKYTTPI